MILVFGKGINDSLEVTQRQIGDTAHSRCPFYDRWTNMLRRCYSETYLKKHPTYRGCTVCEDWLLFSNFKCWMERQDWEGKDLDKDLLSPECKIYSPATCLFVGKDLNYFLIPRESMDDLPLGVSKTHNRYQKAQKYRARYNKIQVGGFVSPLSAHKVWQKLYIAKAEELILKYPEVRLLLEEMKNKVEKDLIEGRETLKVGIYGGRNE